MTSPHRAAPGIRHTARVYDRVRRVSRFAKQASHARAACAGSTASVLVLAVTVENGRGIDDAEGLVLAAIVGILSFLTWTWTDQVSRHGIARRADERLGLGGGLVAAFENASTPERPLAELGARRTLGRIPFARLRAAAVPPFEVFLVLPLLGGVALFRAVESRFESRPGDRTVVVQVNDLAAGIQQAAAAHPGELTEEQMSELAAAVSAAQEAAGAAAGTGMNEAMRGMAEALDEAAATLPEGSPMAEALDRLAFEAEAASVEASDVRDSVEPGADAQESAGGEPAGDRGDLDVPATATGEQPGEASAPSVDGAEGLAAEDRANGGGSGDLDGTSPSVVTDPGASEPGQGTGTGGSGMAAIGTGRPQDQAAPEALEPESAAPAPWWPDRDDALVRAWLSGRQ